MLIHSIVELQDILACPEGVQETLYLANGVYEGVIATILITGDNIVIEAETLGEVQFVGGAISVVIIGNNNRLKGFQWLGGEGNSSYGTTDTIELIGNNNLVECMNFQAWPVKHVIHIHPASQYNQIVSCNFQEKPTDSSIRGSIVLVEADVQVMGYHKIMNCIFQQMDGNGGEFGNIPIQLGVDSSMSSYDLGTIVESCLFENTQWGDETTIMINSCKNILRYNTFRNNQEAMVCFHQGDGNVIYGNYFLGAGGIRIHYANSIAIYNNLFESSIHPLHWVHISTFDSMDVSKCGNHIIIQFNTFKCCGNVVLNTNESQKENGLYCNIFYHTEISKTPNFQSVTIKNNMYWNPTKTLTTTTSGSPQSIFTWEVTNIEQDPEFLVHNMYDSNCPLLETTSPALGRASSYELVANHVMKGLEWTTKLECDTNIQLDITGLERPKHCPHSLGCWDLHHARRTMDNQMILSMSKNMPLTIMNTGPSFTISSRCNI